ncbi:hypothetical protein [Pontibacter lucknowensis]|uniref:hypothetical protein n=1 Tax=Pontibacter lucknowensis TaxID=1077936 RepID=UPI00097033F4|nr:hypothetical protein [Pontibacter lucknowensis]
MRRIIALFNNAITLYDGEIIDMARDGLYAVFGLNTRIRLAEPEISYVAEVSPTNRIAGCLEISSLIGIL